MTDSDGLDFRLEIHTSSIEGRATPAENWSWIRLEVEQVDGDNLATLGNDFMIAIYNLFATLPHVHQPSLLHHSMQAFHFTYDYAGNPELLSVVINCLLDGISCIADSYEQSGFTCPLMTSHAIDEVIDFDFYLTYQVEEGPSARGTCWYTIYGIVISDASMDTDIREYLDAALIEFCQTQSWISRSRGYASGERSFAVSLECLAEDFSDDCMEVLMATIHQG